MSDADFVVQTPRVSIPEVDPGAADKVPEEVREEEALLDAVSDHVVMDEAAETELRDQLMQWYDAAESTATATSAKSTAAQSTAAKPAAAVTTPKPANDSASAKDSAQVD